VIWIGLTIGAIESKIDTGKSELEFLDEEQTAMLMEAYDRKLGLPPNFGVWNSMTDSASDVDDFWN
jgi:hypothetical protein